LVPTDADAEPPGKRLVEVCVTGVDPESPDLV
jgi:hypothetical protein